MGATKTTSFTSTGIGHMQAVCPGQRLRYLLGPDPFVGKVVLEEEVIPGAQYNLLKELDENDIGLQIERQGHLVQPDKYVKPFDKPRFVRLRCTEYTSGTIVVKTLCDEMTMFNVVGSDPKAGASAGFIVDEAVDSSYMARLPESTGPSTLIIPMTGYTRRYVNTDEGPDNIGDSGEPSGLLDCVPGEHVRGVGRERRDNQDRALEDRDHVTAFGHPHRYYSRRNLQRRHRPCSIRTR